MCGIVGVAALPAARDHAPLAELVGKMSAEIVHRGPDGAGVFVDERVGLALGHQRLSIIDLSSNGDQPMTSACGRYVLVYNGEIYNPDELSSDIEGFAPRGHSDTEVLVEKIACVGVEQTLSEVNGMFAFAIWDREAEKLTLARDRFGQKPLYYGVIDGLLVFASELSAIRAAAKGRLDIDPEAVSSFLRFGRVPSDLSIYRGIHKLLPGHTVTWAPPSRTFEQPRQYWSAQAVATTADRTDLLSAESATNAVEKLLSDAVRRRLRSDVPFGVFLSGGIDSTTIAALAQQVSSDPIKTFTVKPVDAPSMDESSFARLAAEHLGTDHHELPVSSADAVAIVPKLSTVFAEPFADYSQIPTFLISALARQHVTMVLGGDGGDEIFAGYNRHLTLEKLERVRRVLPDPAQSLLVKALQKPTPAAWERVEKALPSVVPNMLANKVGKLARLLDRTAGDPHEAILEIWADPPIAPDLVAEWPSKPEPAELEGISGLRKMLLRDIESYLPDGPLVKVDRASMAVSLEVRSPFLDHRLWELSCRLDERELRRGRKGKVVVRRIAERHVPAEVFERPKAGFAVPLAAWLRDELREWASDMLSEASIKKVGLLDQAPIRKLWGEHLAGDLDAESQLWAPIMLQAWALENH